MESRETFEAPAPILWLAARLLRLFHVEAMVVAALEREVAAPSARAPARVGRPAGIARLQ